VTAYVFFLFVFSLAFVCLTFNNVLQQQVPTQDVINSVSLRSFYCS